MNDPKMRVLDLIESGKITADEGAKLIQALGAPKFISQEQKEHMEEKFQQFAQDVSKTCKEVGSKVHVFYKDVEPKIKKASQTALEKAAQALDSLAKNIHESLEKAVEEQGCCGTDACECDNEPKPN